jgi:hypothetical protein
MSSEVIRLTAKKTNKTPSCRIREAFFRDYEQVAMLQARYGLQNKSYEDWTHLWVNNPAYHEFQRDWVPGWVLENETGKIIGYLGNIPLVYLLSGRRLRVSTSYAWVVDEAYRSYSPWLLEEYFCQKKIDLYLNTTVSDQALQAYSQYGSLQVPIGSWDKTAFAITNHRGFAESALRRRGTPFHSVLSIPLSAALYCRDVFKCTAPGKNIDLELCTEFDERFEVFWHELMRVKHNELLGLRSREVLQWHFGPALARNEVWIVAHTQASRITAYAIFVRHDKPNMGLKRMQLADFQSLDGSTLLLPAMLSWAIQRCRREDLHMLEYVGIRADDKAVTKFLPHQRTLSSWLYFYQARDSGLAQQLRAPTVWAPYAFDGDLSL